MVSRRLFLGGLLAGTAAPSIVKASSLMKIKPVRPFPFDVPFKAVKDLELSEVSDVPPELFRGEIGRINGVSITLGDRVLYREQWHSVNGRPSKQLRKYVDPQWQQLESNIYVMYSRPDDSKSVYEALRGES